MPAAANPPPRTTPVTRYDHPPLSLLLALVVLPLYLLDQVTKFLVVRFIDPADFRPVIPNWFSLVDWSNTGAAWGAFSNANPFFIALSAAALAVLAVLYRSGTFTAPWPRTGFCLLLPGVLGNLTDRLVHGHVVDFLLFDLHVPLAHPWPAFNVADSCICVAVGCFLVGSWRDAYRST